jgi:putative restriction endonuclease
MNILERALIEKAGREHGWENVLESNDDLVLLSSARHRGQTTIAENSVEGGWYVEMPRGALSRELDRSLPGFMRRDGRFGAVGIDALSAVLRRAAELSQSLPDQAAQTYRERTAARLAMIGSSGTEVERLVRQRVGQDVFREALMDYWGGACAVTGLDLPEVLRASHAKPWADCETDDERLNVYNGFLLSPHLDALFDQGLISFEVDGGVISSRRLTAWHQAQLGIAPALKLRWIATEHLPFLEWHRSCVFLSAE